ncbi:MAG: hypothetical protein LBG65_06545 [Puniceicoccales bacterium]|jgi:hypothetical protein|nr:hypothetical protein [Puniceicoccales bacterium]
MNQNPKKTNESGEATANNQAMPGGVIRVDEEMIRSHLDKAEGAFPDGNSAILLVAARLRHISGSQWGQKRYLDMSHLKIHAMEERRTN